MKIETHKGQSYLFIRCIICAEYVGLLSNICSTFVMHSHLYLSCDIWMFILRLVCLSVALACVFRLCCVYGCLALHSPYVSPMCYVNVLDACIPLVLHSCARCEFLSVLRCLCWVFTTLLVYRFVLPVLYLLPLFATVFLLRFPIHCFAFVLYCVFCVKAQCSIA